MLKDEVQLNVIKYNEVQPNSTNSEQLPISNSGYSIGMLLVYKGTSGLTNNLVITGLVVEWSEHPRSTLYILMEPGSILPQALFVFEFGNNTTTIKFILMVIH